MKTTYLKIVIEKLQSMKKGDEFCVKEFIQENWNSDYDNFTERSFDVYLCKARKLFLKRILKKKMHKVLRLQ